jgi:hypothetical protein
MICIVLGGCGSRNHSAGSNTHASTTIDRNGHGYCARAAAASAAARSRLQQHSWPELVAAFGDEATAIRQLADVSPAGIRSASDRLASSWEYEVAQLRGLNAPKTKTELQSDLDAAGIATSKRYSTLSADTALVANYVQRICRVSITG